MSSAAESERQPPRGAAHVGAELAAARRRLGWTLDAVASVLRVRPAYLEAIEAGRLADLPGNAYAVAYLRSYAGTLGFDADEMARRFRVEAAEVNRKPVLDFPVPMAPRGVPAGAVVLLGLVLAASSYVAWLGASGGGQADKPVAAVPERLAAMVPNDPRIAPSPQVASVLPAEGLDDPPPSLAVPTALPVAALPYVPPSQAAAATLSPAPFVPAAETARMVLRAKADSWLQLRDRDDGNVVWTGMLRVGETWPVPDRARLVLTTGNAGGTEVLVDGVAAPSLGKVGAVRRDLPLEPEAIMAGAVPGMGAVPMPASTARGVSQ